MKKLVVMFLTLALVIGCIPNSQGLVKASDGSEPVITYNNGVMSGMGLDQVIDGNRDEGNGYVSDTNLSDADLSGGNQYFQFEWNETVNHNSVTLYSRYCGTADTNGQAPTKWKIQTSADGNTYTDVATVTAEWVAGDALQSKSTSFTVEENYKFMRVVILEANLHWEGKYYVAEIEFATESLNVGTNEGVYVDSNGTTQYAKAATVAYNDSIMTGNGLLQVADGDYTTTYVSEDDPDMTKQYIQYTWNAPIDINLVTLYSQYCGTTDRDGQAPTEWTIQVSKDGTTFSEVCKVSKEWKDNDNLQSKNSQFDLQEDIVALRIVITKANLNWKHYVVSELEVGQTEEGFVASDITGTTQEEGGNNPTNEGVYTDDNGTTQYAKAATVTYNNTTMSGMGLLQVADGNYTTGYVSEDNPNMSNQYIQYTWNAPVDINLVTLYSQYCGTPSKDGQAPTEWTIQVSKDGTTFTEVCKVSKDWKDNDNLQSKNTQFDLQEDILAMRVVITKANLSWNHYAVLELEVGQTEEGFVASDITGTTQEEGGNNPTNEGVYTDDNGTTQYAKAATVTYNDNVMDGKGLSQVADGNYTTTYVSEDNPNMANQYIQFAWNEPVDINMVTLYAQYCGTKYRDGQAPTAWTIQVSKDGTNFTEVCKVSKKWRSNDNLQSRSTQFDLQEDVVAVRIVITEAKLDWNHYAISEIEIGQAEAGFVASDLTGIDTKAPQTGDSASPIYLIALMVLSLGGVCVCTYRRKRY